MPICLAVTCPNGSRKRINIIDDATTADLQEALEKECGVARKRQVLKGGFPPKPLDLSAATVADLGIKDRDAIILSAKESKIARQSVPADGACLFNSILTCLQLNDKSTHLELRQVVKDKVLGSEEIDDITCQLSSGDEVQSKAEYGSWIMGPDKWGGDMEIGILAEHFQVQIVILSIETGAVKTMAPDVPRGENRIFLLYDERVLKNGAVQGLHYDPIVDTENGSGCFGVNDADAMEQAVAEAKKVSTKHKVMQQEGAFQCGDCMQVFAGMPEISKHAMATGHANIIQLDG
mmetsp:Transcript_131997/g.329251  ORF Transcript_131997/g.329251 Transcript_131997/m.329251 type:complete len:292 (+) Transcript_131997:71-946(+)|eukprot:CAMPEP_0115655606 /NCGR_PEP_ID=MMETSP0272-20121206/43726_1 /TAXON_ID=71861 /ORGANISM="Scrippsiella trochoidea, Strain CCMP3099" /LENGTH=291 /DNA_ID=CAMNT_0003093557 /DNA_START=71 /DNA_END=946 /DNA_ORIENTATION=+